MINLNNIKAEMARKDVKVGDVSKVIKKSYSVSHAKLNGKIKFSVNEIIILADYLNVDVNVFFKE